MDVPATPPLTSPRPIPVTPPRPVPIPPATPAEAFWDAVRRNQVAAMAVTFGIGVALGVWIRR